MVAKMLQNPKVAIVHQVPFTTDQKGLAASVEKVIITIVHVYLCVCTDRLTK